MVTTLFSIFGLPSVGKDLAPMATVLQQENMLQYPRSKVHLINLIFQN